MTRNLVSTKQLQRSDLFKMWAIVESALSDSTPVLSSNVALLFDSPSTRTKFGFEHAAHKLGARTICLDGTGSRLASGESLRDSLHTLQQMSDQIIVVRTRAPLSQLDLGDIRVINAGDAEEHPTQALVDLFTIATLLGQPLSEIGDFTIYCCAGRGAPIRPIVSLCWLLQTLGKGRVLINSELPLSNLDLPRLSIVDSRTSPSDQRATFGYVLESFDEDGNIQPSAWVNAQLREMSSLQNLHPLPRLEATNVVIKDEDLKNPVSTQLKLQVPVKMSALLWVENG